MKILINDRNDVTEIVIEGNVLQENVSFLRCRLNDLIDNGRFRIILNLSKTNYISSLCLAVIIDVKLRLQKLDGDLKIAVANRLVRNLMEITNLVKQIELHNTIESAIDSF
ncbi:MAG: STAS domain-containing protein [Fibrobacter sp.]|nr:STAS domain-containing protein [Fibrobacter sp.]